MALLVKDFEWKTSVLSLSNDLRKGFVEGGERALYYKNMQLKAFRMRREENR